MIKKAFFLSVCLLLMSSCYTVHFSKGSAPPAFYQTSQWHHIGLLGLMEFSDPVNLEQICPKDSWQAVRVRTGFLQGLLRLIYPPLVPPLVVYGVNLSNSVCVSIGTFYSPEEVSVSCKKQ